jgi:hypothetical protein
MYDRLEGIENVVEVRLAHEAPYGLRVGLIPLAYIPSGRPGS